MNDIGNNKEVMTVVGESTKPVNDYIKRENAISKLKGMVPSVTRSYLTTAINDIPAADVEHVVRCGQCENWNGEKFDGLRWCAVAADHTMCNFYCARGKERER